MFDNRDSDLSASDKAPSSVLVDDEKGTGNDRLLDAKSIEQDERLKQYAEQFLMKTIRLRGVKIERGFPPRSRTPKTQALELRYRRRHKDHASAGGRRPRGSRRTSDEDHRVRNEEVVRDVLRRRPSRGFAVLATVPTDVMQYYVHAFRIMQKLADIYGWRDFLADLDAADDETLGKLAAFLGVMLGAGGAVNSLIAFAQHVARPAIQKQIANRALTKSIWYRSSNRP